VVVPLTTLANWERELATWAPYLRLVSLKGSAAARKLLLEHCCYAPPEAGSSSSKGKAGLQVGCLAAARRICWAAAVPQHLCETP
jgi:hypothetical protein